MGSGNGNQHVLAVDLYFVDGLLDLRAQGSLARADVELPAVPRASHRRSLEQALGERPPLVRANPVDRRDDPLDIIKRVDASLRIRLPRPILPADRTASPA